MAEHDRTTEEAFSLPANAPHYEAMKLWQEASLLRAPRLFEAETTERGVRAFFYESVPFRGRATRVFAYYGRPAESAAAEKLPAMVLVHGGLGSAYAEWVRLWTSRGYAAIAMDHFGCIPETAPAGEPYRFERSPHPLGGPPGGGGFEQIDDPLGDQWTFHAVAATLLANSLLRSFPEVDSNRIGLTGISWGAVIAVIAAGIDSRFRFVVPVYGCGFMTRGTDFFADDLAGIKAARVTRWNALWDPSNYLSQVQIPSLWINGTNDTAFSLGSWKKSIDRLPGKVIRSIQPGLQHGQHEGAVPREIAAFAGSMMCGGIPLPHVGKAAAREERELAWKVQSTVPLSKLELHFTHDRGGWMKRFWQKRELAVPDKDDRVSAVIDPAITACFVNVTDDRGCTVSSNIEEKCSEND